MSVVISAFPGTGKSTVFETLGHNLVKDSDSSNFPKADFPANYIKHIKTQIKNKVPYILVSSHQVVRDALFAEGIDFLLVYPALSCKEEYLTRYRNRGNTEAFVKLLDSHFEQWVGECQAVQGVNKIELAPGEFLSGVIRELRNPTAKVNDSSAPTITPALTGGMVVYVDDVRDPRRFLPTEQCKDVWWIKHWWAAKNFLFHHEDEIEVLHLDHYLGNETGNLVEHLVEGKYTDTDTHPENTRGHSRDREHTGTDLFHMVRTRRKHERAFKNLKYIYLHSSATDITRKLMAEYKDELAGMGVALVLNTQGW